MQNGKELIDNGGRCGRERLTASDGAGTSPRWVEANDEDGTLEINWRFDDRVWDKWLLLDSPKGQNDRFWAIMRSGYKNAIFEPLKPFIMKGHFGGL